MHIEQGFEIDRNADFPASELWRLFIDGYRQNEGPFAFDVNEKGYLEGVVNAYAYMMNHIGERLTPNFIVDVHNMTLSAVNLRSNRQVYTDNEFNFRGKSPTNFGILLNDTVDIQLNQTEQNNLVKKANMSPEGLQEFVRTMWSDTDPMLAIFQRGRDAINKNMSIDAIASAVRQGDCYIYSGRDNIENMQKKVGAAINEYYKDIQLAKNDDEKLAVIIKFVKYLEVNHFFSDANCRTMVCVIMNKLLIENGFCPAIHENPNRIDGYSVRELLNETKNSMNRYQEFSITSNMKNDLKSILINAKSDQTVVKQQIRDLLSNDPACALAQLNMLFLNPNQYFNINTKSNPIVKHYLEKKIFDSFLQPILSELYAEKVKEHLERYPDVSNKVFSNIMAHHKILENNPNLLKGLSEVLVAHQENESLRAKTT